MEFGVIRCKIQGTPPLPYVRARQKGRNGHGSIEEAWDLTGRQENPPHVTKFLKTFAYLYYHVIDMAYITPPEQRQTFLFFPPTCLYHSVFHGAG